MPLAVFPSPRPVPPIVQSFITSTPKPYIAPPPEPFASFFLNVPPVIVHLPFSVPSEETNNPPPIPLAVFPTISESSIVHTDFASAYIPPPLPFAVLPLSAPVPPIVLSIMLSIPVL